MYREKAALQRVRMQVQIQLMQTRLQELEQRAAAPAYQQHPQLPLPKSGGMAVGDAGAWADMIAASVLRQTNAFRSRNKTRTRSRYTGKDFEWGCRWIKDSVAFFFVV